MRNHKLSRPTLVALLAAVGAAGSSAQAVALPTVWGNIGSDWYAGGNWVGGMPTSSTLAVLPLSALHVNPDIGTGTATADGLTIDNTLGAYSISPTLINGAPLGTLTLGTGNFAQTGGGTSSLNLALRITAPTTFDVGPGARTILAGRLYGGSAVNSFTKEGAGTFQIDQASLEAFNSDMAVNVNAGVVEVRNALAFGNAPSILVDNGAVLQLDPALSYRNGVALINPMFFGNASYLTTLKNGSTLRSSGVGFNQRCILDGTLRINNGAAVNVVIPTNGDLALTSNPKNVTNSAGPAGSVINVSGAGVFYVNGHSSSPDAYTGSWIINHGIAGGFIGQTFANEFDSLGVTDTGYAAPVTLQSGFLTDAGSDSAHPLPNPITLTGGILNANANATRSDAYLSGTITVQSAGGSTIDMSSTSVANLAGPVCNITVSGQVGAAGLLFVTAPTTVPINPAVLTFANTSQSNPNTLSGNVVVQWNAKLAAKTSNGASNPLGTATITLAGGELKLDHAGSGNNGTIDAFAANSVALRGYANGDIPTALDHNGTLTLGNAASGNSGNTIVLNRLTFDATGTATNQTLNVRSAGAEAYRVRFDGVTMLAGNSTIANTADVILNNKVTGAGNLTKSGPGTLFLNGASSDYTGSTTVNGGVLAFGATHKISSLTVNDGAQAVVTSGGNKLLKVGTLNFNGTGALNLTDEDAILTNSSLATVRGQLKSGQIFTDATIPGQSPALGYATAQQLNTNNFDGEFVNPGDVLVRYTLAGDANLDGAVNALDFTSMATNFNKTGQFWVAGDFNYDGVVNSVDFNAIAGNFGGTLPTGMLQSAPALGAVVPEPMSLALIASVGLLSRRQRR